MHSVQLPNRNGLPSIVYDMLTYGADINDRDDDDRTPLHLAVENNLFSFAKELIAREADIMVQ